MLRVWYKFLDHKKGIWWSKKIKENKTVKRRLSYLLLIRIFPKSLVNVRAWGRAGSWSLQTGISRDGSVLPQTWQQSSNAAEVCSGNARSILRHTTVRFSTWCYGTVFYVKGSLYILSTTSVSGYKDARRKLYADGKQVLIWQATQLPMGQKICTSLP